jgi:hypothetical protein
LDFILSSAFKNTETEHTIGNADSVSVFRRNPHNTYDIIQSLAAAAPPSHHPHLGMKKQLCPKYCVQFPQN